MTGTTTLPYAVIGRVVAVDTGRERHATSRVAAPASDKRTKKKHVCKDNERAFESHSVDRITPALFRQDGDKGTGRDSGDKLMYPNIL